MSDDLRLFCNSCKHQTKHGLLRSYEQTMPDLAIGWQIVHCLGCETVSFYEQHSVEAEEGWEVTNYSVYPPRQYREIKQFVNAPENVERLYRETVDAFNSRSLLFCAGGLRALVESICAQQGVREGPKKDHKTGNFVLKRDGITIERSDTLDCKIEGLAEKSILATRQAAVLHEHRYLGNKALHELDYPEVETLKIAINIIEHLMDDLYSIPSQADGLKRIRESGGS